MKTSTLIRVLVFSLFAGVVSGHFMARHRAHDALPVQDQVLFNDYVKARFCDELDYHPVVLKLIHHRVPPGDLYLYLERKGELEYFEDWYQSATRTSPLAFALLFLGAAIGLITLFSQSRSADTDAQFRRGARLDDTKAIRKQVRKAGGGDLQIGDIPIPRDLENFGFLICGGIGTGKSVTFCRMLDTIAARGDRAIIADSGGLYAERYGNARSLILNPFDARSIDWSPLAEMHGDWDADAIAKSFIPDGEGNNAVWSQYAQTVLAEILKYVLAARSSNSSLVELACNTSDVMLFAALDGTPAGPLIAPGNGTMGANIRAILSSQCKPLQFLNPDAGADSFSITRFMQSGEGWLHLTYLDNQLDTLKPIISAALDIASRATLSLAPDSQRRIWLVADEFASLGKVQSFESFATKARKFGGAAIVGLQSIAQLRDRYGRDGSQSILSCLASLLVLRQTDAETAEAMSKALGDQEVSRTNEGGQDRGLAGNNSTSWTRQVATQRLILPSELQNLPNLEGYLNLGGHYATAKVRLTPPPPRKQAPAFIARDPSKKRAHKTTAPSPKPLEVEQADTQTQIRTQTQTQQRSAERADINFDL